LAHRSAVTPWGGVCGREVAVQSGLHTDLVQTPYSGGTHQERCDIRVRIGSLKHFWRRRAGCRRRHLGAGILVVTEAAHVYRHLGTERLRTREFRIGRNCCGTYTGKLGLGA